MTWTAVQLEALARTTGFRNYAAVAPLTNVIFPDGSTALDNMVVQQLALKDGDMPLGVVVWAKSFVVELTKKELATHHTFVGS